MPLSIVLATVVFVALCIASDVRSRRIPNVLCLGGMVGGLVLNIVLGGVAGGLHSVAGLAAAIVLLLPAFAVGGIGGGDVKMMGALGALVGVPLVVAGLVCGMVTGGVIMLLHLWRLGRVREKLMSTWNIVVAALAGGSLDPLRAPSMDPNAISLPYSVPLGVGVFLAVSARLFAGS